LQGVWFTFLSRANAWIDSRKPWTLANNLEELDGVLAACCECLRWAALMLAPAMPDSAREILRQLGRSEDEGNWPTVWGWPGGTLSQPKPVFPRIEPERQAELIASWVPAQVPTEAAPATTQATAAAPAPPPADVTIDDFAKIELRAAKVLTAERVPKADKLLKLTLDVGAGEPRTVVSGIAPAYTPEAMVGKTIIYFSNLAPRKIRGVVSHGMILAADAGEDGGIAIVSPDKDVAPGSRVR
jgi:methionyl-tRNA synthetase